jgi:hypothetical protein
MPSLAETPSLSYNSLPRDNRCDNLVEISTRLICYDRLLTLV